MVKRARDFARRHDVPKWYDDADQLINDPDVNRYLRLAIGFSTYTGLPALRAAFRV